MHNSVHRVSSVEALLQQRPQFVVFAEYAVAYSHFLANCFQICLPHLRGQTGYALMNQSWAEIVSGSGAGSLVPILHSPDMLLIVMICSRHVTSSALDCGEG